MFSWIQKLTGSYHEPPPPPEDPPAELRAKLKAAQRAVQELHTKLNVVDEELSLVQSLSIGGRPAGYDGNAQPKATPTDAPPVARHEGSRRSQPGLPSAAQARIRFSAALTVSMSSSSR